LFFHSANSKATSNFISIRDNRVRRYSPQLFLMFPIAGLPCVKSLERLARSAVS
jgi:hypothetical protein